MAGAGDAAEERVRPLAGRRRGEYVVGLLMMIAAAALTAGSLRAWIIVALIAWLGYIAWFEVRRALERTPGTAPDASKGE